MTPNSKLRFLLVGLCLSLVAACSDSGPESIESVDSPDSQEPRSESLEIQNPRARTSRPPHANSAAFMTLKNHSDSDMVMVGVKSNRAKISELHTMVNDGDVMKMRRVDNLVIPANGELILQPGSDHLMFFELDKGWRLGDTIELELLFAKYPSQKISAVVE